MADDSADETEESDAELGSLLLKSADSRRGLPYPDRQFASVHAGVMSSRRYIG
jgi:hypothetical protein